MNRKWRNNRKGIENKVKRQNRNKCNRVHKNKKTNRMIDSRHLRKKRIKTRNNKVNRKRKMKMIIRFNKKI